MATVIIDLEHRVVDSANREYFTSVIGAELPDTRWEVWLEFVPLDDSDVLATGVETWQSSYAAVEHWAGTLTDVFVEGAFSRARPTDRSAVLERVTVADELAAVEPPLIDPFEVMSRRGAIALRAELRTLTRAELLAMIDRDNLNPARKSLARLSNSQLVTFIVTAVEVQDTLREKAERFD